MCIITDENDVVVSISFIPGCDEILDTYKVYFPWVGELPSNNTKLTQEQMNVQYVNRKS